MHRDLIEALNIVAKDDVLKEVISHIENIELYGAIAELDETEREIVGLFYFSNLSIKEIARLTGLSTTNTKVKLHRSRLRLKKKMEERDDF